MPVVDRYEGIIRSQSETKEATEKLSEKIDRLVPPSQQNRAHSDGGLFQLYSKAKLVWWTALDNAASYIIELEIGSDDGFCHVGTFETERTKRYLSLKEIPYTLNCRVTVKAQNRDGKIIDQGKILL